MTKIEWTNRTWNPVTGCTKCSEGCKNCYAEVMTRRLKGTGNKKYANGFKVTTHEDVLDEPDKWTNPSLIFVCSMSDLFHEEVPFTFIDKVMDTIRVNPWHIFQILTKRADRMEEYYRTREVPNNAWIGVTVENEKAKKRIEHLNNIDTTAVRFISCEPLLEDLGDLNLYKIDWVIVGGESGRNARPMKEEWVLNNKRQADAEDAAFFFKQWGAWGADGIKRNKKENGSLLQGKLWRCFPV